jgi:hypothetical protein
MWKIANNETEKYVSARLQRQNLSPLPIVVHQHGEVRGGTAGAFTPVANVTRWSHIRKLLPVII